MKKIYIFILAFVFSLALIGFDDIYAAELENQDNDFYFIYEGEDFSTSGIANFSITKGTYFKWSIHGYDPLWKLYYNSRLNAVCVWYNNSYSFTLETSTGRYLTNNIYTKYGANPQVVNTFVGGANLYTADVVTVGSFVSDNSNVWSPISFGDDSKLTIYGMPVVAYDPNTMSVTEMNSIIDAYPFYNVPIDSPDRYPIPQLLKITSPTNSEFTTIDFHFNNTSRNDVLLKNIDVSLFSLDGQERHLMPNGFYSQSGTYLSYSDVLPSYVGWGCVGGALLSVRPSSMVGQFIYSALEEISLEPGFRVNTITFDIAYAYSGGNSKFVHVVYNATDGTVLTNVVGNDLPDFPLNVPSVNYPGYIVSPDTNITGNQFVNILVNWLENISVSFSRLNNVLLSFMQNGLTFAQALGQYYTLLFGTSLGQFIQVGIVAAIIMRFLGR